MRKTYALLKPRIAALTFLLATIVMVYSCKKNIEQNEQNTVISQLETLFNSQKINGLSLAGKFADAGLNPNWKNAIIKKNRSNKPIIIVQLQNTANSYAEMDMVLSKGSVNSIVKKYTLNASNTVTLDIFRPSGMLIMSGLYHVKYKKFTPDQSPVPNISLFSPNNQLTQQVSLGQSLNLLSERLVSLHTNKLMGNSGGGGSTDDPEEECPPGTICLDDVTITAPAQPSPSNDYPGVDIPDLPPPGPVDYFPTDPSIPTGTETSSEPPTIEVKQDSLQKYYPCMVKEVLKKLTGNQSFGKLIQPFQKIQLPNGGLLNVQGLPNLTFGFSAQSYGGNNNYSLGTTSGTGGYSSKIEINSEAMSNSSQLFLQIAVIHEVAHAYAKFYIKAGSYGFPVDTTRYSTWAMNIINFESVAKSEEAGGNFNDHSLFLENYVDNFVQILKDINGTAYTDKQYKMAAIYGLNYPGERTYNYLGNNLDLYAIYKSKLEKSYNNLLVKYGITVAERDAFYLDNLKNVAANKKLPTNCP